LPKAADRLLLRAARRAPAWTAALALAIAAGAAVSLLVPAALAAAVDAALHRGHLAGAVTRLAALLAAGAAADVLARLAGASYEAATTAWLRRRLLGQAMALGVRGQRRFPPGDLLSRIGADAPAAGQVLPDLLQAGAAVAAAAGAVLALALLDWRLAAVFLLGLPPALALVRGFMVRASDLFVRYQRLQAAIAARLVDALAGIRTIRASGTGKREVERVLRPLGELSGTGRALWHTQRRVAWGVALLVPLEETLVLAVAGMGLAAGRLSPGELLAAAGYVRLALRLFEQIDVLVEAARARAGAARAADVLDEPPARGADGEPPASRPAGDLPRVAGRGAVSLRGVTVRAGATALLDRLDLEVPAGACVALVGHSGAGKTTLAWLVGRLGEPDEGTVLLDGVPVAALVPHELRRAVAYAFERPTLLGATVAGAIAYGRPAATRAEVERAARAAAADGFVRRLPEGYQTPMEDAPLSGGEAQRLGLARAVAQDGHVLVLDDATSSLDTATEMKVSEALAELLDGRTRLVVAHRAATAARADLVAWLDGGRVRALAPHAALWENPEYRAVFAAEPGGPTAPAVPAVPTAPTPPTAAPTPPMAPTAGEDARR
jgi:ATP-binding cassette subfamily B protein